jgi:hypothetical protein
MLSDWKNELARDLIALGSPLFYSLVVARALIGPFFTFFYQLIISVLLLYILSLILKSSNSYVSRGFVLTVLTGLFYQDIFFAVFSSLIYLGLIFSAFCLGISKREIRRGVAIGMVSVIAGYLLAAKIPIP